MSMLARTNIALNPIKAQFAKESSHRQTPLQVLVPMSPPKKNKKKTEVWFRSTSEQEEHLSPWQPRDLGKRKNRSDEGRGGNFVYFGDASPTAGRSLNRDGWPPFRVAPSTPHGAQESSPIIPRIPRSFVCQDDLVARETERGQGRTGVTCSSSPSLRRPYAALIQTLKAGSQIWVGVCLSELHFLVTAERTGTLFLFIGYLYLRTLPSSKKTNPEDFLKRGGGGNIDKEFTWR